MGFLAHAVLAHVGGTEEITYVFLPMTIFFVVFRLVRGKRPPPPAQDPRHDDRLRGSRSG